MFTSLSKIISWSPNPWCDGVTVHEVFDRVLVRLGLERETLLGAVTWQHGSWPHGALVSHSQGTEYRKWMQLTLLSLLCCRGSSRRHDEAATAVFPQGGLPMASMFWIMHILHFCLFLKNCLEPQLLRFLLGNLIFLLHCRSWICYPVPCTGSYTTDTHMGAFPF